MRSIILASVSPRRKQLMMHLGLQFKVVASNYREVHHKHLSPAQLVKFLAEGKAAAVARKYRKAIVIGADTVIVFNGKIFGKPKDKADAKRMLKLFSGKKNYVYTGVCVVDASTNKKISRVIKTTMQMRKLNNKQIDFYISTGEPMDKSGAYGPLNHGWGLVKTIKGDFTNSLGLPMEVVAQILKKLGVKLPK